MKNSLYALTCFNHIENISMITSGLSQACYKVNADNKVYFAKTLHGETETNIALKAAEQGFCPAIFYHDKNWLVTTFIENETLALATVNNEKNNVKHNEQKIHLALRLMSKCHQLNVKPKKLIPKKLIIELIDKSSCSSNKKGELLHLAELILAPLNTTTNLVCCHGDLNFSNVLIDQRKKTWLVDYECACLAPVEYDLAMFIAINNIEKGEVSSIIKFYRQQHAVTVDRQLLDSYQLYCYLINALWYSNACTNIKYHNDNKRNDDNKKLNALAIQQWRHLNSRLNTEHHQLLSGLSIKLRDVLTAFYLSNQT